MVIAFAFFSMGINRYIVYFSIHCVEEAAGESVRLPEAPDKTTPRGISGPLINALQGTIQNGG